MSATFSGLFLSVLIALPRIWFDSIKLPTKLARIRVFMQGESQPSPRSDLVPTSAQISPLSKSAPTAATFSLFPPRMLNSAYSVFSIGLKLQLTPIYAKVSAHLTGKRTRLPDTAPHPYGQFLRKVSNTLTIFTSSNFLSLPISERLSFLIKSHSTKSRSPSFNCLLSSLVISAIDESLPDDEISFFFNLSFKVITILPRSKSCLSLNIKAIFPRLFSSSSFSSEIKKLSASSISATSGLTWFFSLPHFKISLSVLMLRLFPKLKSARISAYFPSSQPFKSASR